MHGMSVAGRRGEILWKRSFTGIGRQLTYDTCQVRFGLFVPFALGDVVHIWDIPVTKFGGPCKAIRLCPDSDFKRRVLTANWIGLGAMLGCIALFLASLKLFVTLKFVAAAAVFVGSVVVGGLGFWLTRLPAEEARHRAIRLLLGLHEWGSSDPATWSEELVAEVVAPKEAFGVASFAALAEKDRAAGRWGEAMWAARLCAAVEDDAKGETLTDAILGEPLVIERLRRVRKRPDTRDQEFDLAPGLEKWVNGDPEEHILAIG
ncbi:MAG: hypothetical protein ACJ8FY_25460 [Gemmataceae bacterium]